VPSITPCPPPLPGRNREDVNGVTNSVTKWIGLLRPDEIALLIARVYIYIITITIFLLLPRLTVPNPC